MRYRARKRRPNWCPFVDFKPVTCTKHWKKCGLMEANVMSENIEKLNRREALTKLGKAAAAAAVISAAGSEVLGQSSTLSFVVDTYRAYYYSAPQYSYEARIFLYSPGLTQNCVLVFMKEGQTIPANTVAASGLSANVYFANTRLAEIREFLRNERPVRVTVVGSNGIATLSNEDYELVGDGDV